MALAESTPQQKILMFVLLIVAAGVVFYLYGLPYGAKVEAYQKQRADLRSRVELRRVQLANLDKIRKERAVLEGQLAELLKRLPPEREIPQVLRSVTGLARSSGLTVVGVKRKEGRPQIDPIFVEIPMTVSVQGGYPGLLRFAEQVGQLPRLVTISELQIKPPEKADAGFRIQADLVATVYQAPAETITAHQDKKPQ